MKSYLPRLLSLLVGQEAILSLNVFFLQDSSDFTESSTSSFLISRTSCMRQRVKSWKEIFPFSSAPSWCIISATDSSMFSWRHTISKSFLKNFLKGGERQEEKTKTKESLAYKTQYQLCIWWILNDSKDANKETTLFSIQQWHFEVSFIQSQESCLNKSQTYKLQWFLGTTTNSKVAKRLHAQTSIFPERWRWGGRDKIFGTKDKTIFNIFYTYTYILIPTEN